MNKYKKIQKLKSTQKMKWKQKPKKERKKFQIIDGKKYYIAKDGSLYSFLCINL